MHVQLVATCALTLLIAGCGEPLFLMYEEHLEAAEGARLVGAACESIGDGSSATGAGGEGLPPYSIEHQSNDGESVRVLVRDGTGKLRAERIYNEDFLRSHDVDEVEVVLDSQQTLRLRYWGGTTCEEPRVPE